jgi:hypothetical protein
MVATERGEYDLAAGQPAQSSLAAMAAARNDGYLLPEQAGPVSALRPVRLRPRTGTFFATPLERNRQPRRTRLRTSLMWSANYAA